VIYDGHDLEEEKFAMEVAGTLGDFATKNQCSVGNLIEQLKQKDMLVKQLQNQIKIVEQIVINDMKKGFE
jgi:hypothetical protein